jgi:hypothetical protein
MDTKLVQIKTIEVGLLKINGQVVNINNHIYSGPDEDSLVYIDTTEILSIKNTDITIDKKKFAKQIFGVILEGKDYKEETMMVTMMEDNSATVIYSDDHIHVYRVIYVENIPEEKDIYVFTFDYKANVFTVMTKKKGLVRTITFENMLSRTHMDNSMEAVKPITLDGEKIDICLGIHKVDHYAMLVPYNRFERRNYFKNIIVEAHVAKNPLFQKYKYYIEED